MNNGYVPHKPIYVSIVSHNPEQWDQLINACDGLKFWAYIFHDKDVYVASDTKVINGEVKEGDLKPKHLHIFAYDTPKTLKSWSNRFEIPINFVEAKSNRKASLLYLTHESNNAVIAKKTKYERSLVKTSNPIKYQEYITSGDVPDYVAELNDLLDYQNGKISLFDFLQKHQELLAVSPYQRINLYKNLLTIKKF